MSKCQYFIPHVEFCWIVIVESQQQHLGRQSILLRREFEARGWKAFRHQICSRDSTPDTKFLFSLENRSWAWGDKHLYLRNSLKCDWHPFVSLKVSVPPPWGVLQGFVSRWEDITIHKWLEHNRRPAMGGPQPWYPQTDMMFWGEFISRISRNQIFIAV